MESSWAYKAVSGNRIVGGIIAMPTRDGGWYIDSLFVDPEFRKKRVATLLMERVLAVAGKHMVSLDVKTDRAFLPAFYAKFGFTVVDRLPNYYNDGSDRFLLVRPGIETSETRPVKRRKEQYYAQFLVTMPKDLYTVITVEALERGTSLNQVMEDALREQLSAKLVLSQPHKN